MKIKVDFTDTITPVLEKFDEHQWECQYKKIAYQVWLKLIEIHPEEYNEF